MRFYTGQHRFYCGIDLHARSMHVCVLDAAGTVVYDRNLACHFPREGKGRGTFFFVAFRGPPRGHEVLAETGRMSILNVPVPWYVGFILKKLIQSASCENGMSLAVFL